MHQIIHTNMREAFERIAVKPKHLDSHGRLLIQAEQAIRHHSGERRVPEWNAHLKLKTYNALCKEGVMT